MPYKNDEAYLFYYHAPSHLEMTIDNVKCYRNERFPAGVWKPLPPPYERLLDHVQVVTKARNRTTMLDRLGIQRSCVSRLKNGVTRKLPMEWLVRLSDYSTIPLYQLYVIAGIKPFVRSYDSYA